MRQLVVFTAALRAAAGDDGASADACACVGDLRTADLAALDVPGTGTSLATLAGVLRALDTDLAGDVRAGALVVRVLRIGQSTPAPRRLAAIAAVVDLVAPDVLPKGAKAREQHATRLWADCWLALHNWIVAWNRRHAVRQVA